MVKPYYEDNGITIYHGDCREILPTLEPVDLVLTDPPYPDYHTEIYKYEDGILLFLKSLDCRQLVFWSAKSTFPLDYSAIHIWDKKSGAGSQYERIFERNGGKNYNVYRYYLINSTVAASFTRDIFYNHPSQKPIQLITRLVSDSHGNTILDPFMGSGTTLVAAKQLNRKAIGIEIEEKYCEIAVKRLQQSVFEF
jgi:DNA modification methylase